MKSLGKHNSFTKYVFVLLIFILHSSIQSNTISSNPSHEEIDYLIITADHLVSTLEPLAEWKTTKGTPAEVISISWIEERYDGRDRAERIRNYIKDAYNLWNAKYILLAGDIGTIPMRYVYLEEIYGDYIPPHQIPTDDYYCNLEGDWDLDGDGIFGEPPILCNLGKDEIDWTPEPGLYLGRLPADDVENMATMVEKILSYEQTPVEGDWRRRALLVAAVFDENTDCRFILDMQSDIYLEDYECIRLYESAPLSGDQINDTLTPENFIKAFNEGASIIYCRGHGDITCLSQWNSRYNSYEEYSTVEQIYDLTNDGKLPFVMHCTCLSGYLDYLDGDCIGEALMKAANGGAIIFLGSVRESFTEADFILDDLFGSANLRPGVAFRKAKLDGLEWTLEQGSLEDWKYRAFPIRGIMLGDPELQIIKPTENWIKKGKLSISLSTDKGDYGIGDSLYLIISVEDENLIPVSEAELEIEFEHEDSGYLNELSAITDKSGQFVWNYTWVEGTEGNWHIKATASKQGHNDVYGSVSITVAEVTTPGTAEGILGLGILLAPIVLIIGIVLIIKSRRSKRKKVVNAKKQIGYCIKCGTPIKKGVTFCQKCGSKTGMKH